MEKGFFESLFDFSFTNFITPSLVKILYGLTLAIFGVLYLVFTIGAFSDSVGSGLLVLLVIGPIALFFYTLFYRVIYELIIVIFRIYEVIRDQGGLPQPTHSAGADIYPTDPPTTPL